MNSRSEGEVSKDPKSEEDGDISGITQKPWGTEELVYLGEYAAKILRIDAGKRTSYHYHKEKDETIFVHSGRLLLIYGGITQNIDPGKTVHIIAGDLHSLGANSLDGLVLFEASTPHLTDVVRVRDDYGRGEED